MALEDTPEGERRHRHHPFIPAGILIGLGAGLLVNFPVSGVLIGLGCGFIATSFTRGEKPGPSAAPGICCSAGTNWILLLVGIFLVLLGAAFIWQPVPVWPYLVAILLILLGIGFALRGFRQR